MHIRPIPNKQERMAILRLRIFRKWRDYLRGKRPTPQPPPTPDMEDTYIPPPPKPVENDEGVTYLTMGGRRIPEKYINASSNEYLIKPESGADGNRGLCILLPWRYVGYIERAEIITNHRTYELHDATRTWDLPTSPKFPNGARVHLRNGESGKKVGVGTLRAKLQDGSWSAWHGDFGLRKTNWTLVPEGPLPFMGDLSNANAEEINDVIYEGGILQIPESWGVYSIMLFTYPLNGATMILHKNGVPPILLYEMPEIGRGLKLIVLQLQSEHDHVTYELIFNPSVDYRGTPDAMIIYTPIGKFPVKTHNRGAFQEISANKWALP